MPTAATPAFCRVAATLRPTSDSDIKIEVWLPTAGWNGKFQAVGNGGWAGTIAYAALARRSSAATRPRAPTRVTSATGARLRIGHPEKLIDFGYRAVHEMTVKAKAIIDAFYGARRGCLYWNGCSPGGRQGITEAQRYPADFDADHRRRAGRSTRGGCTRAHAAEPAACTDAGSYIPAEKYPVMHQAVLEACDALDGVKDGVHRGSAHVRVRSEGARMQERGRTVLPDAAAGGGGAKILRR